MTKIEILPLDGIYIENVGKILLGQSKSDIEKLLGQPSTKSSPNRLFYKDYELRIDLNKKSEIEFIEFICGPFPEKTELSLYGIDPFKVGADNLLKILAEKNNGQIDDSEADYSFAFINISVGVWRDATPEDVKESIDEAKANNEYEENKHWLEEDLIKANNFWTIGIGIENYFI